MHFVTVLTKHLLFLYHRAPEGAPLKSKMIYASSKDAIKKKFTGETCLFANDTHNASFILTNLNVCIDKLKVLKK